MKKLVLALDPSSTCTGYALLASDGSVLDSGRLKPSGKWDSWRRIKKICQDLKEVIDRHNPTDFVVEVGSKQFKKQATSLSVYGMAVGAICMYLCQCYPSVPLHFVEATKWTAGKTKAKRLAQLALIELNYYPGGDLGGDIGDAICLGQWWLRRQKFQDI